MPLSNYPPGVTGREPQISGYAEGTMHALCDGVIDATKVTFVIFDPPSDESFNLAEHGVDEIDCKWTGKLDVRYVGAEAVGDCPRCGNEIRIDLERD